MLKKIFNRVQRSPALRGISSFASLRFATKFMTLIRLAFIAHFIGPAELGAYQLSLLAIAISEVFTETGINVMLLKHPQKLSQYLDTAWVVSIIRGALITAGIVISTPYLADFYGGAHTATFLYVAAFIPFFRGFINPAVITFQQKLQFGRESGFRLGLQLLDIITGAWLAWYLQSAVGLIIGLLIGVLGEVVFSFLLFDTVPRPLQAKWSLVVKLYQETKFIIGNGILHYLTENLDDLVIGKVFGTAGLGLYNAAYSLASSVTNDFGSIAGQTLYPIYAQLHAQKKVVRPLLIKSSVWSLAFLILVAVPLLGFTQPLIQLLLGEQWLATVPLIRLLFLAGVVKSFVTSWNPVAILADLLYHHVIINVITIVIMVGGIIYLAQPLGLNGAGWAVLLAVAVVQPYAWWVTYQAVQRLDHGR